MSTKRKIQSVFANAKTVEDLIDLLGNFDLESPVMVAYDYGDIVHTTALANIGEVELVDEQSDQMVAESAYSSTGLSLEECDEDPNVDQDLPALVVLHI